MVEARGANMVRGMGLKMPGAIGRWLVMFFRNFVVRQGQEASFVSLFDPFSADWPSQSPHIDCIQLFYCQRWSLVRLYHHFDIMFGPFHAFKWIRPPRMGWPFDALHLCQ
jgi:hypothetical protein